MAQLDSLSKFDVEESIRQEVREWSRQTLESPSKELGGMSACPYAKKTWDAHQVLMTFKRTKSFIDVFESPSPEIESNAILPTLVMFASLNEVAPRVLAAAVEVIPAAAVIPPPSAIVMALSPSV